MALSTAAQLRGPRKGFGGFSNLFKPELFIAIMMNGLQTVRINLRKKLLRETPDYEALATSLASAIVKDEATKDASFSGFESSGASTAELEKGISELSKLVSGCVLKTNNGT